MQDGERVFYPSENGDRWLLMSIDEEVVSVRHVPNAASGGEARTIEIGGFLLNGRHSAQNQALRALISSLTRAGWQRSGGALGVCGNLKVASAPGLDGKDRQAATEEVNGVLS